MPMLSIDNDLKERVREVADRHQLSIKGTLSLLLDSMPQDFDPELLETIRRIYPTREKLSSSWDSFWKILKVYINNSPDKTYTVEEAADLASCSTAQMQCLFDLMVLIKYIKVAGKGYIKCRKGEVTMSLKEARQVQYDHRANDVIDLLEKHPEGLPPKEIETELDFHKSWLKGCTKNPLIKNRVIITADLWKLSEEAPKKRRKAPVKRRKKVSKTS